jgi:hypothetical protein
MYGEKQWSDTERNKPITLGNICPSATLSTTNPTWTAEGSNSGLCSERPKTICLSHDTTKVKAYIKGVY